jgi:16S rRNA (cytosine967-C5)-methyltransferase
MKKLLEQVLPPVNEPSRRARAAGTPGVFRDMGCFILGQALDPKGPTDKGIGRLVRAERRLGSKDRPMIVGTLFGVLRRRSLLEKLLEIVDHPVDTISLWQAELILSHGIDPADFGLPAALSDLMACLAKWRDFEAPLDNEAIATLSSLPKWIVEALSKQEPAEDLAAICASLSAIPQTTLRVNCGKITVEALSERLRAEGVGVESGLHALEALRVDGRPNLIGSSAYKEGLFEIQDEASQMIADLVEPIRGGLVLDYCAGSGGKTLAMAARMPRGGKILATDPRRKALAEAEKRVTRAGAKRVRFHWSESGPLPLEPQSAARVLVDAPCTGTGSLRHQPVRKWRLLPGELPDQTARQAEILDSASKWVSPGGRLIYATCSLLRAENEDVIEGFLEKHPDWRTISIREVLGRTRSRSFERGGLFRSSPHLHATDGFTAAILVAPRNESS